MLSRKRLRADIKQYAQFTLDPNITTDPDEPIILQKDNGKTVKTTLHDILDFVCTLDDRMLNHRKNGTKKSELEFMENLAKNAVKHGVGNCGDLADLLVLLLREYHPENNLAIFYESVCIRGRGDHAFLVINRDPASDIRDVDSWGPDAIICDPWFRETVVINDQLSLSKQDRANCITYLFAYINEPHTISSRKMAGSAQPHSAHWYNKYGRHSSMLFINRKSMIPYSPEYETIDKQYTTLIDAVMHNYEDIVVQLITEGADPNKKCDGMTPLLYAILDELTPIIKHLITAGADTNLATSSGETPLIAATVVNNVGIVEILLEAGADIDRATNNGETALSIATDNGCDEIKKLLMDAKHSLSISNKPGP
ncbi:MAG: ankyrin repeat domain-containing protein [Gammaproteobacteria bacterium]